MSPRTVQKTEVAGRFNGTNSIQKDTDDTIYVGSCDLGKVVRQQVWHSISVRLELIWMILMTQSP